MNIKTYRLKEKSMSKACQRTIAFLNLISYNPHHNTSWLSDSIEFFGNVTKLKTETLIVTQIIVRRRCNC